MNAANDSATPVRNLPAARAALAACALAVLLPAAALAAAGPRSVDERRAADPRGSVEIVNVAGRVEVLGWDRPEVQVRGRLGARVERLDFTVEGTRTRIRVVLPQGSNWNGDGSAELVVQVPWASGLATSVVSADIRTRGVRGEQRLQTVSGGIDAELGREAQLRTVSGNVRATPGANPSGPARLDARTVSGDVDLGRFDGEIEARTVSGDIELALGRVTSGQFQTVSGDVDVAATVAADGRVEAETVSGDVKLRVLGGVPPADYELESFGGDVRNCFGPKPVKAQYGPGTRLAFREGAGTARVRVDTKSGDLSLCDR